MSIEIPEVPKWRSLIDEVWPQEREVTNQELAIEALRENEA